MAKSKKARFEKIKRLTRYYGEVEVVFTDGLERERKRKISKKGHSFVSYFGTGTNEWSDYSTSCFVSHVRGRSLSDTLKRMYLHDRGLCWPNEVITPNGKVIKL